MKPFLLAFLLLFQTTTGAVTNTGGPTTRGSSSPPTFSDNFAYTGPLSANWTCYAGGFTVASGFAYPDGAAFDICGYTAGGVIANDQFACTTISADGASTHDIPLPGVRLSSSSAGYITFYSSNTWNIFQGTAMSIASTTTPALVVGHQYCLFIVGTNLTLEDFTASTTILTVSDSTYASGYPGMTSFGSQPTNQASSWRGGAGTP